LEQNVREHTIEGLTENKSYTITLTPLSSGGTSRTSVSKTQSTLSKSAPKAPQNLHVSDITTTSARLDWSRASGWVQSYIVTNTATNVSTNVNWWTYSRTITGLTPDTEYSYIVTTKNSLGTKGSYKVTFKTDKDNTGASAVRPTATIASK